MFQQDRHLYNFGPFRLDTSERLLLKDGVRVPLTEKAFDTLIVLVRRSGHLVSKEELMAEVWPDAFVEENNLDKSISAIRQALGEKASAPDYVETIRGRGYRFVASVSEARDGGGDTAAGNYTRTHPVAKEGKKEAGSTSGDAGVVEQATGGKSPLADPSAKNRIGRSTSLALIAGVLALGLSAAAYFWLMRRAKQAETSSPPKSIAVLPFKPLATDDRDESLELGMADTLITKLSAIRNISVRPVSAVRRYTSLEQDPVAAGKELGVDAVLDGSIQRAGERVRVTVRLVSVKDGSPLWAGKFDEQFTDIFAVQDAISEQVTHPLTLRLSGEEKRRLAKRDTNNTEAYELYLRGRYFWNKRTGDGIKKAIEYFRQAVALDSSYALAYSGLADAYSTLTTYSDLAPKDLFPHAKEAAVRALELDDTFAEAHTSLAFVKEVFEWDWAGAESGYRRALELNPSYAPAHHRYGIFLCVMGRFDEGLAELERARFLDPTSLIINVDIGLGNYLARRYDRCIDQLRKSIEMEPTFIRSHLTLADCYVQKRMFDEAIAEAQKASEISGGHFRVKQGLSYSYAAAGRQDEAREVLKEITERAEGRFTHPLTLAAIYAALGDKDKAFELLKRGYEQRSFAVVRLRVDPRVDSLRSDPRFQDLLRRVGLTP